MTRKTDRILRDAANFALRQENDGIKFFCEAAEKAHNPLGKAMFRSFIEDEKEHIRRLEMMTAGIVEPEKTPGSFEDDGPRERLKTIFEEMQGSISNDIPTDAGDLDAIKIALNIERKVYKFYEAISAEALNVREKELYKFLAREEIIHFQILKNAYTHLSNLDKWHVEETDRTYEAWMELIKDKDPRFG
ncbi:MAG: ferritin family protein [Candidatus Anammoxibacter sp.]